MNKVRWRTMALLAALAVASGAQAQVPFTLAGETVRVITSSSPGGTGDLQARLLADRLSAVLPGRPTIVVQGVRGGGGMSMLQFVQGLDPATEHFVYVVSSNVPFEARRGAIAPADFDPRSVQWIGSYAGSGGVCVVSAASGITSVEDLRSREVTMGTTDTGSTPYGWYMLLRAAGLMIRPIVGYDSAATIMLAISRNEIGGVCTSYATYLTVLLREVEAGTLVPIVTAGAYRLPLPGVPWALDLDMPDDVRTLVTTAFKATAFARPWLAAAGADPDFVAAMRSAFAGIVADPAFAQAAVALDVELRYASPEAIAAAVDALYGVPDALIAEISRLLVAE